MKKLVLAATTLILAATLAAPSAFARGPYRFNQTNTAGWSLMTPEERTENMNKMHSFKTYDECKAYQEEHHKQMEARAKEKGVTMGAPRHNACDQMKARGYIK